MLFWFDSICTGSRILYFEWALPLFQSSQKKKTNSEEKNLHQNNVQNNVHNNSTEMFSIRVNSCIRRPKHFWQMNNSITQIGLAHCCQANQQHAPHRHCANVHFLPFLPKVRMSHRLRCTWCCVCANIIHKSFYPMKAKEKYFLFNVVCFFHNWISQ